MNVKLNGNGEITAAPVWILTVENRRARLFEGSLTPAGRFHVEERASLSEQWDEYQHGRPSSRTGKDGHTYASQGHEEEERVLRFAKQVAEWLTEAIHARNLERVHAFLAPRISGHVHSALPSDMEQHLIGHTRNLGYLGAADLAQHSAIRAVEEIERSRPGKDEVLSRIESVMAMTKDRDCANQMAYNHVQLLKAVKRIRGAIDRLRGEETTGQEVADLHSLLLELRDQLHDHFALEEESDFFSGFEPEDAKPEDEGQHLLRQHQELSERLASLLDAVARAESNGRDDCPTRSSRACVCSCPYCGDTKRKRTRSSLQRR